MEGLGSNAAADRNSPDRRCRFRLYPVGYNWAVRPVRFLGDSLKCLRDFPDDARHDAGYQLDKVQRGNQPDDFKPIPAIGKGVEEGFAFQSRVAPTV